MLDEEEKQPEQRNSGLYLCSSFLQMKLIFSFSRFPLPCSSDSMQSADDDTTAPPRPTEFNLQVRQLKLTKTGDAESFTVGAAAAIAAEKTGPAQRYGENDCGHAKGRGRVEHHTIRPAWPARVGISLRKETFWLERNSMQAKIVLH